MLKKTMSEELKESMSTVSHQQNMKKEKLNEKG